MKKTILFLAGIFTVLASSYCQKNPLINFPSISPNGQTIAFNYQGDLWTCSITGNDLKRLTIHEAYDTKPVWSKDGKTIAFQSDRFGNSDIFTIPVRGGIPKRITYHSTNDRVTDFTEDNSIIFETVRQFVSVEREAEIHSVSANGGTPFRLLGAVGFDAVLSPNKKFIAFTRGTCRIEREAYKGPANRDVWLYNVDNESYSKLTSFEGQDFSPKWASNSSIYFLSARSGKYNVHQINLDANGVKTGSISNLSSLKKMGLYSFSLSKNGKDVVMVSGDQIWHLDSQTKKTTPISINIHSDYRFDPVVRKSYSSGAREIEVSPNGKYSVLVIRGELFVTENDSKKSRTINISNSPYKDSEVLWLNDDTIIFVSDRNGSNNLYKVSSADENNKNIFTSLKHHIEQISKDKKGITSLKLSPDKKQLAYTSGYGKLLVASISDSGKLSNEKVLLEDWNNPSGIAWSPDSKWLAYSLSDLYFNDEIYIHKADNSQKPINVSLHPKSDFGAVWSADGSKLGFTSDRNNGDLDVWFIWLRKKDWEKTQQDWEEISDEKKSKKNDKSKKDKKSDDKKVVDITIDFEDIHERQHQITSFTGGEYLSTISKDGKTFYYVTGNGGRGNPDVSSNLFQISWEGKDKKDLTKGNTGPRNISLNSKGDYLYYLSRGMASRIKLVGAKKESLPFRASMKINYTEESNQIFEEAWNAINMRFYDPAHHGQNWGKLKQTYKPLALKASTRADFKIIFNRMLGQINASHMGMYQGEERKSVQREQTGQLGVEFEPTSKGQLKISKVITNSAADREASKLNIGDIVLAVNGEKVSASENIYQFLEQTANEKIILTIKSDNGDKELIIRPKSGSRADKYSAWVKERKQLTHKYSNGRLGYIHIQGMNWRSFERFERELTAAGHGKDGVVIDVRYNGGGWTTDYLMAVLNVKQHAYTIPRGAAKNLDKEHLNFKNYYPFSERLPLAAWTKPSIALCNQNSYSNAEIFSHAYKELGLGKLVGTPTFGAVISTGSQSLIDGSYVRIPFRGWYVKSSQKNMDFTPAMPDIVVDNNPDEKENGTDSQLLRAVNELLKQI